MKIIWIILAFLSFLLGVLGGPYMALYQGWFKGILGIINFCREGGSSMDLAFSIIRILCASFIGTITFWFCCLVGKIFLTGAK